MLHYSLASVPKLHAKAACLLLVVGCTPPAATAKRVPTRVDPAPEKLALTPPMGFNNWNAFGCDVSEQLIRETADFLVSSGLKEAGYQYVNIDDCWSLHERDPDGRLVPDPEKFPSKIHGLADYVHSLGLKLGIYGDAGTKTCAGYPGSLGNEELDAQTWADWGIDYLKYDNCYNQSDGSREDYVARYTKMREAIDATGRPMVYSICEWGQSRPWEWATDVGHLWRTTGDINDSWSSVRSHIASNAPLAPYAGPGHWNDPDMLEIGNGGMTPAEYRTHMSMWSLMAAPLMIGTDLRKASADTLAILANDRIIAIDQDPLGKQASVVSDSEGRMVFAKPLANGDVAVAFYNSTDAVAMIEVAASQVGLTRATAYRLNDLWTRATSHAGAILGAGVAAHGAVVFRAAPLDGASELPATVSVGASLDTLIPSEPGGAVLTAVAKNHGITAAREVAIDVKAPKGWDVKALDSRSAARLGPNQGIDARFEVSAPNTTPAGSYTIAVNASHGAPRNAVIVSTELLASVVVPPPDGVSHLSQLAFVSAEGALGPVERDMNNGDRAEGDGNLITLGGKVYRRGLGTRAPSEIVYYLGGRCSTLTTEVGLDDALESSAGATFSILADDQVAATSGAMNPGDPPKALQANLEGARWLKLVTQLGDASYGASSSTDWATPVLTCGATTAPNSPEIIIFSFEEGSPVLTLRHPEAGGRFAPTEAFSSDGSRGLEVTSPADGNWFGRRFEKPLDLQDQSVLAFDVRTNDVGTPGEFAVQVGPDDAWCQGGHWAWTNPDSTRTVKTALEDLSCPQGVSLDRAQIQGVWVFLKAGTFVIDTVRAE